MLSHPRHLIRDTQLYIPFRQLTGNRTPSLKRLVELVLKRTIQKDQHSSVEDAIATMELYKSCKDQWEQRLSARLRISEKRKKGKKQKQKHFQLTMTTTIKSEE
jgi:RNA exonuclease 4